MPPTKRLRWTSAKNYDDDAMESSDDDPEVIKIVDSPGTNRCCQCPRKMNRKGEYACGKCALWPLCGKCILDGHLDCKDCFNVVQRFQKRIDEYALWWKDHGLGHYPAIHHVHRRVALSVSKFNYVSKISPCLNDTIFRVIVTRAKTEVELLGKPYRKFMDLLHQHEGMLHQLRDYCSSKPRPLFAPMASLLFPDSTVCTIQDLSSALQEALQGKVQEPLERALNKLSNINRLLELSIPKNPWIANSPLSDTFELGPVWGPSQEIQATSVAWGNKVDGIGVDGK